MLPTNQNISSLFRESDAEIPPSSVALSRASVFSHSKINETPFGSLLEIEKYLPSFQNAQQLLQIEVPLHFSGCQVKVMHQFLNISVPVLWKLLKVPCETY